MKHINNGTTLRSSLHLHDLGVEDYEPLRGFDAEFSIDALLDDDSESSTSLGAVTGWICWRCLDSRVADAGDVLSADAHYITYAAEKILEYQPWGDTIIEDAVLIDRIATSPEFRRQGYLPLMIDELVGFLRLDVIGCILVTQPEPQKPEGRPYCVGEIRDRALTGLCRSLQAAEFDPRNEGPEVWWRCVPETIAGVSARGMAKDPNSEETEKDAHPDPTAPAFSDPHQPKRAFRRHRARGGLHR